MAKDRLTLQDKYGNERDYDVSSEDVTLDNEGGKSLKSKLSEIDEAVGNRITSVTFNGNTPTKDSEGNVNLGQQAQADWGQMLSNYPSYIRNKPTIPTRTSELQNDAGFITASQIPEGSTVDNSMSSTSENAVQNKVIKAYVDNIINGLVNSAPAALDTLNELAAALGNDANFAATITQQLANVYTKSQTYSKSEVDSAVAEKQDVLTFDNAPTANSNNLVKSGGIKTALDNLLANISIGQNGNWFIGQTDTNVKAQGPTGNVQVDGNGNVLIVNNLEDGGPGAALSAEMGKRLALMAGTFAEAWARSKAIPYPFCFLWNETIDGDAISKPIWHKGNSVFIDAAGAIVNVEAASVPNAPTITGATSGDTVPKNTQITITPASGSALYYSLDGGTTYNVSDAAVTVALTTAGSVSIVAYCANNKGNSSNATLSVTVAGTAVPEFTPNGGEVSRGGSVTISVPTGGELHYKIDSGSWTTASGTSVSIPITGATTIQAYNVQDGDTSDTITKSFTMAALASPTFSVATGTEFPIGGGSVELTGPAGATLYYTTNGDTPTTASTQYTGAIAVASAMTIKAIAHDTYGDSAVAEASYTVVQPKIVVTATEATTMSLGETGLTSIALNGPTGSETTHINEFTIADINTLAGTSYTSFADHVFPSLSFGDRTKISTFDGGGLQVNSLDDAFSTLTAGGSNPTLTKCVGIVLAGQNAHASQAFTGCTYLTECELSGVVNGSMNKAFNTSSGRLTALDISGLSGHVTDCGSMFMGVGCEKIDVSQFTFTKDKAAGMFRGCSHLTTIKVGKIDETGDNYANLMFKSTNNVTTIICTETEPYTTGWLEHIKNSGDTSSLTAIYVPDASVNDYKAHSEWGTYTSIIKGISEYTE